MIRSAIVRTVSVCAQFHWAVIAAGVVLMVAAAIFDVTRFSINTDVERLIAQDLPWHARQIAFMRAFPQKGISAVITASTPENSEQATNALAQALKQNAGLFPRVAQPDSGDFFGRNQLLLGSTSDVRQTIAGLTQAEPLLSQLSRDPSLRGVMNVLSFAADQVRHGQLTLEQLKWPLTLAAETLNDVLSGKPASFSWKELLQGHHSSLEERRHFLEIEPHLDFTKLQPGSAADRGIHDAAAQLDLKQKFGAVVKLTGQVPMDDQQFSVIRDSALRDTLTAAVGVLIALWLALRSWKIIAAVFFSLLVGLATTAALGLAMVGSFNLISIAFFVLFVGLGVDFGIQFSVRYRAERHELGKLQPALESAARKVGTPLALAAAATAVGFFAFLPTSYSGLSELGLIAGCGMLIAFACSITLVPAMLALLNPPGEAAHVGFTSLGPLDDFLQRHRIAVVVATIGVVVAASPLLLHLPFDFNPVNLQSPNSPAVVTYRELQSDPETSGSDAEVLAPSIEQATATATRLNALPQVSRTVTVNNYVPSDQDAKIAELRSASGRLRPALAPRNHTAPTDEQTVASVRNAAKTLSEAAGSQQGAAADAARNVTTLLTRLAETDAGTRQKAEAAVVSPLLFDLEQLRQSMSPQPISIKTLPPDLLRDWVLPDGRARVEALPKGDPNDSHVLQEFAAAVLNAAPTAAGAAITYYEGGRTITAAFIEAGAFALVAISVLLFVTLRRFTDVLLTIVPLLLAGAVTLEICVLGGLALNFANIIALPLLLGVGVAFKIYYIMAWRAGKTGLLQSALTRAVVFSAMTNAIAFGSMWASNYPGMSSMGKLMGLALLCTMAAAVLFQPVLMGPPRQVSEFEETRQNLDQAAE
ncbi:MMPL family transporter [Bradyrhizobium sp. ORS 111]|uniref:hopanoid transporter HpnN n=1 Tax=Bradyrhizobium sp. ORS 111 TaxID=1685958 RepID=UPI00388FC1E8